MVNVSKSDCEMANLGLTKLSGWLIIAFLVCAGVAELADARDSKSRDRKVVWVQVPPPVSSEGCVFGSLEAFFAIVATIWATSSFIF